MGLSLRRALMPRIFHLLYHQFAWSYDVVSAAVSLGRWQDWGEAALPFVHEGPVLELGHGPGHLLVSMNRLGLQPVGIDLSPQMGRLAGERLNRNGILRRLARGRGQALPFADGSFNTVVAAFPAPYIIFPETLAEISRVVHPDGRLVIVPEAELTGSGPLVGLLEWLYRITGQRSDSRPDGDAAEGFWNRALAGHFSVTIHTVAQPSSLVTVIVAERYEAP